MQAAAASERGHERAARPLYGQKKWYAADPTGRVGQDSYRRRKREQKCNKRHEEFMQKREARAR